MVAADDEAAFEIIDKPNKPLSSLATTTNTVTGAFWSRFK